MAGLASLGTQGIGGGGGFNWGGLGDFLNKSAGVIGTLATSTTSFLAQRDNMALQRAKTRAEINAINASRRGAASKTSAPSTQPTGASFKFFSSRSKVGAAVGIALALLGVGGLIYAVRK